MMNYNNWEGFPLNSLITEMKDKDAIAQVIIEYFRNNNSDINTKFSGYNCLHYAVSTSNRSLLQLLRFYFIGKIDINATTDEDEETALHLAIQRRDLHILQILLQTSIDPNIHRKVDGRTALHLAVFEEDNEIFTYLLENSITIEINARDNDDATALHYAVQNDNWYRVYQLLEHRSDLNAARKDGKIPLHISTKNESTTILRKLVYMGTQTQLNKVDNDLMTPLYLAVIADNMAAVEILLEEGADPDWKPRNKESIIAFAFSQANPRIFEALLKKSRRIESKEISTNLFKRAIDDNDEEKVEILLANGVNPDTKWRFHFIYKQEKAFRPLIEVVKKKKPGMVKILLKYGACVNIKDDYGNIPLHLACELKQIEIAKILLQSKHVDVNIQNKYQQTPLHISCQNDKDAAMVEILLDAGADPNITYSTLCHFLCSVDTDNMDPIDRSQCGLPVSESSKKYGITPLHIAIWNKVESMALALLKRGADPNILGDDFTPLELAIMNESTNLVKLLLQYKYQPTEAINITYEGVIQSIFEYSVRPKTIEILILFLEATLEYPMSPERRQNFLQACLKKTVRLSDLETLKVLLKYGANPEPKNSHNNHHNILNETNNFEIMKLLIEYGADVNGGSYYKPLRGAILNGNVENVTLLLEHGADPNVAIQSSKHTPLHLTIQEDYYFILSNDDPSATVLDENQDMLDILEKLLEDKRINVNAKMHKCTTPFDMAVAKGKPKAAELLLRHNAHPLLGMKRNGRGLIHFAIYHKNNYILKELLEHGLVSQINSPYKLHSPPLLYAIENDDLESFKLLLQYGADVNQRNDIHNTVLKAAIRNKNKEYLKLVLEVPGLDVNEPHYSRVELEAIRAGSPPLHLAVKYKDKTLVSKLLELGADPNIRSIDGSTILHIAVMNNFLENILEILFESCNLDVDVQNNAGLTPLHLCCQKNENSIEQKSMLSCLLKLGADLSVRCKFGNSAIHYLAISDALDILCQIKCLDAALLPGYNLSGETPLHCACKELNHKSVKILLDAGALSNLNNWGIQHPFEYYITAFLELEDLGLSENIVGFSVEKVLKKVMELLVEMQETMAVLCLLKFNEEMNFFSVKFLSCLMNYAIQSECVEMVRGFLKSGANVNFIREWWFNNEEHMNLYLALKNREMLQLLLTDEKCDVNLKGKDGKTALHYAVEMGLYSAVRMLLEKGADPNSLDCNEQPPSFYCSDDKIKELLVLYSMTGLTIINI